MSSSIRNDEFRLTKQHQFILLAQGLQSYLYLPTVLLPITVFSLSGILHVLGALTAEPLPAAWPIFSFFALSGVGCTLELAYRKYRGKRVGGVIGWLWTWTWLGVTGRSVARSWIDSGVLGSTLVWDKMDVVSFVMKMVSRTVCLLNNLTIERGMIKATSRIGSPKLPTSSSCSSL